MEQLVSLSPAEPAPNVQTFIGHNISRALNETSLAITYVTVKSG
jgi:hypothetical protein